MDTAEELMLLAEQAATCTACGLAETRTNVVFGDGSVRAQVMFVGEGPGRNEDLQGLPFVGAAGQLLNRLLSEIGLQRSDTYITNVVKCRPPGNRDPRPDEITACKDFLSGQIRLIDPVVVVTLGNFATKLLLREERGITRLRGRAYPWWNRTVIPTFHPAAALRGSASVLASMQEDFALVKATLDGRVEPPSESEAEHPAVQLGLFG
ncbi:MAG: uracil-DNA glycosylase [Acidimicrobiia bacterium]|nr:uracil-DNA glycosylase [Acidimicrobiia bacterium]MDH3398367.1 uracil-DNA glycosylase [Acidimicrobiia bacterium]